MGKVKSIFLLFSFLFFILTVPTFAVVPELEDVKDLPEGSEERYEAKALRVKEEIEREFAGIISKVQVIEVEVLDGPYKGKTLTVENILQPDLDRNPIKKGEHFYLIRTPDSFGNDMFYIGDYVRRKPLLILFSVFILLSALIGGVKGLKSIIGMFFSILVIFYLIIPKILSGADAVMVTSGASVVIILVTFYLAHGFDRKTSAAVLGTLVSLIFIGTATAVFVNLTKLTGFASEEAGFLQVMTGGTVNVKGLLMAGIIIGVLGVLDDITISQSAIVNELIRTDKMLSRKELYLKAMNVGRDHIASMINTLVLVYTGAALPLLLLFSDSSKTFAEVISYEIVSEEIVRILIGSIGLILAVPLTTLFAVILLKYQVLPTESRHKL